MTKKKKEMMLTMRMTMTTSKKETGRYFFLQCLQKNGKMRFTAIEFFFLLHHFDMVFGLVPFQMAVVIIIIVVVSFFLFIYKWMNNQKFLCKPNFRLKMLWFFYFFHLFILEINQCVCYYTQNHSLTKKWLTDWLSWRLYTEHTIFPVNWVESIQFSLNG